MCTVKKKIKGPLNISDPNSRAGVGRRVILDVFSDIEWVMYLEKRDATLLI